MTGLYVIFGGMILFVTVVVGYDLFAERHNRHKGEHRKSA